MHDLDRMKTKVEIRLGASQVFGLAMGTAVCSALLFVAGYMVGKQQVPTVAPAPDLARLLSDAGEEGVERRPTRAAVGEVEFLFPKAGKNRTTPPASKNPDVRLPAAVLTVDIPKKVQPKRVEKDAPKTSMAVDHNPAIAEKKNTLEKIPGAPKTIAPTPPVSAKPIVKDVVTPGSSKQTAQTSSQPKVDKKSTALAVNVEESDQDEDRPSDDGDIIPSIKLPKIAPTRTNARLKKKNRVPKVDEALKARKSGGAKRASKSVVTKTKQRGKSPRVTRGQFTLQVKATKTKAEAETYMTALRRSNFFPHLIVVDTPKKGRFYRIRVGRFETMEEARAFQREFSSRSGQNESGYVTRL